MSKELPKTVSEALLELGADPARYGRFVKKFNDKTFSKEDFYGTITKEYIADLQVIDGAAVALVQTRWWSDNGRSASGIGRATFCVVQHDQDLYISSKDTYCDQYDCGLDQWERCFTKILSIDVDGNVVEVKLEGGQGFIGHARCAKR